VIASNTLANINFRKLTSDAFVSSGFSSPGTFFVPLKPGITAGEVANKLGAAKKVDPRLRGGIASNYYSYFAEPQTDNGQSDCRVGPIKTWPINVGELKYVLDMRRAAKRPLTVGKMVIFDTGFPEKKEDINPFSRKYFVPRPREFESEEVDRDEDDNERVEVLPTCKLLSGELQQIPFQEAHLVGNNIELDGNVIKLDMRKVESITFCDDCYF
jgi:hypothetical protein